MFGWEIVDVASLTAILYYSQTSVESPLIVCYPLFIIAAGLWYRARYVWLATVLSVLSYGLLWWEASINRPDILRPYDIHSVYMVGMIVSGFLATRLVRRIQTLSRTLWYRR
jgi:hypothetical protein